MNFSGSKTDKVKGIAMDKENDVTWQQAMDKENDVTWQQALGKRYDQGHHECEVWLERDVKPEGAREWRKCRKNPGHIKFIPSRQFSLQHLPEYFRDDLVMDYIRILAERTVRLVVMHTSLDRPDGYIFSNYKGTDIIHTGSGLVYCFEYDDDDDDDDDDDVNEDGDGGTDNGDNVSENLKGGAASGDNELSSDEDGEEDFKIYPYFDLNMSPCPCPECTESDSPHSQWGYVHVQTARHVVFDTSEAKNTIIELYFDDENDRQSVRTLYGMEVEVSFETEEFCRILCVTHDRDLYCKLYDTEAYWSELRTSVNEKYWESKERLALLVSHPHGWSKQISVGEWKNRHIKNETEDKDELTEYEYDTPTCTGSSGAPVFLLGQRGDPGHKTWFEHHHTHSGTSGADCNISGMEMERFVDLDDDPDDQ